MINMGIGQVGGPGVIHKRKFRWTFQVQRPEGNQESVLVPEHFVKMAARPNISIEETEINFLNAKTYIPGKGTWETITVTYYDVGVEGGGNVGLWTWLANVYDYTNPVTLRQNSIRRYYSNDGICTLFDGCGSPLERWTLGDCWPQAVNFGELDYSSSEECTIEVTLRYAQVRYESLSQCVGTPSPVCVPCGDNSSV
jgi:hypothetical protein